MIKQLIKLLALFMGFTLIIGVSAYLTVVFLIESEETVVVPDLKQKHVVWALEILTDLELNIKVKDSRYSQAVAKHHVIRQDPAAGSEIKAGRDVQLVISKGPRQIVMPDLCGETLDQARLVLEANTLTVSVISKTHTDKCEARKIISQVPAAGSMVARQSPVHVLVSRGPRPRAYMMPDLSGMPFASVVLFLEKAGLSPGKVSSAVDKQKPKNTVIDQDPSAGSRITEGSRVSLTVNRRSVKSGSALAGGGGVRLFRYRVANGFLNRHIKATLNCYGMSIDIYDAYRPPGSEVWILVPAHRDVSVVLREDGSLVETSVYSGW